MARVNQARWRRLYPAVGVVFDFRYDPMEEGQVCQGARLFVAWSCPGSPAQIAGIQPREELIPRGAGCAPERDEWFEEFWNPPVTLNVRDMQGTVRQVNVGADWGAQ